MHAVGAECFGLTKKIKKQFTWIIELKIQGYVIVES